jgi:uncharacterized protein (TIGR02300 family)
VRCDTPRGLWEKRLAKTDLGAKQVCPNCGAKFYDLGRRPATCPKCTTSFDPAEEGVRARRGRARVAAHDPSYDDDEEVDDKKKKAKTGDDEDEEEEAEEATEIDAEAEVEPLVTDDEEEETAATGAAEDELPEGFSEDEGDLGEDAADDDTVPLIDDEEEFPEDEIGEIGGGGEDDDSGR